jgi:hypothetical protein
MVEHMKKIFFLTLLFIISLTLSCSSTYSPSLKVIRWGPENAKVGEIPNKQPDGKMGIWIDVTQTQGLGEMEVLFDGKPVPTSVEPKLITAGVSPEAFTTEGEKKVEIKILNLNQIIQVGTFKVTL